MTAKVIRVSDDDGATWDILPGGTGEFNSEGEQINDTIFGQSFESNEMGLISWSVEANALYKGFAGYVAKLKRTGTSTAVTGEAMSQETGLIYAIDDETRSIWDRNEDVIVYDDAVPVDDEDIEWIDYLFGRVKFVDGYTVTGDITVDVNYMPTEDFGRASSFTLTQTAETIDTTTFDIAQANNGYRTFDYGLKTVSLELTGIYDPDNEFKQVLRDRAEIIIEINPDGNEQSVARGYFRATNQGQSGDVGALEEETIEFSLNVPEGVFLPFNWKHEETSTIPVAVRKILDAYITETKLGVQYLPDGVGEQGEEGIGVVTDVSLTSGLDAMNEFAASFQGDGEAETINT